MKSLHIRNIPEGVIDRLKLRAQRQHRSLQGELMSLLTQAAASVETDRDQDFSLTTVKTSGNQNWSRDAIYED